MRSDRQRSRLNATDLAEVFRRSAEWAKGHQPFDENAHKNTHRERVLVYTSTATLSTTAGSEFYLPFGGEIKWVSASVAGAPSSGDFKVDLLLDGNSVFEADYLEIPQSQKYGYKKQPVFLGVVGSNDENPTPLKVQINTINGATGPLILYIGLEVE